MGTCCLLWIDKARAKDKRYIWVSVWWMGTSSSKWCHLLLIHNLLLKLFLGKKNKKHRIKKWKGESLLKMASAWTNIPIPRHIPALLCACMQRAAPQGIPRKSRSNVSVLLTNMSKHREESQETELAIDRQGERASERARERDKAFLRKISMWANDEWNNTLRVTPAFYSPCLTCLHQLS